MSEKPLQLFAAFVLFTGIAQAQVVNPATAQQGNGGAAAPAPEQRYHTFDTPAITVFGKAPLAEEDRIGDYAQPRWTAHRRFSETRVYVVPKGMAEFEFWAVPETDKDGNTETKTQYEMEFGLGHRMQLDLYAVAHQAGNKGAMQFDEQKVEFRYAFADWNKIWGNPTAYLEWASTNSGADVAEFKLLLGGQIRSGWHWGSNLVFEQAMGDTRERSKEWTTGISYSAIDSKISIGLETQLALENEKMANGSRTTDKKGFLLGPSFQFRPVPNMHIDLAPLAGVTHDAPRSKVFVVVGWEF
jgi:hypothetical protein